MEQGVKAQKGHKKAHHPHLHPKPETGYTDEAAEECHDLFDQAEAAAHMQGSESMYTTSDKPEPMQKATGGLQGSVGGAGKDAAKKMQDTGKNVSETVGQKMGQMKKTVGLEK